MIKHIVITIILALRAIFSYSQNNNFKLEEITFLSGPCNGTCPDLSINIYDDRRIELSREIYKSKGVVDTSVSKNYKGILEQKEFNKLIELMKQQDWDTLKFPDVQCCDAPVISIIIYYNGKSKRLKSMTPPQHMRKLIEYLTKLGEKIKLPFYEKPIDFES